MAFREQSVVFFSLFLCVYFLKKALDVFTVSAAAAATAAVAAAAVRFKEIKHVSVIFSRHSTSAFGTHEFIMVSLTLSAYLLCMWCVCVCACVCVRVCVCTEPLVAP